MSNAASHLSKLPAGKSVSGGPAQQSQERSVSNTASRRAFIQSASASAAAALVARSASASEEAVPDATVSERTGPHGNGHPITLAGYEYNRVRALIRGQVPVQGFATSFEITSIGPLNNHAFFGPQTRDVTEIGLIPFILAFANDNFRDYLLLPIPILRQFRHKSIFIRTDRGIRTPEDLRGRKVATVGYSSSGLTHVRGVLQEGYGVKPNEIQWISTQKDSAAKLTGGASRWEKVRPDGVSIENAPDDQDESSLLLSGAVDAIFHPAEPKVFQDRNPLVARLFEDHRTVEQDYFKRTGIFPIMHSVAIRKSAVKKHPDLPEAVFRAYSAAKTLDYEQMKKWGWVKDSLPWYGQEYENTRELMGNNFYPYGFETSKASYDTAVRYLDEQGLSKRRAAVEELFEPSSLSLNEAT